MVTFVVTLFLPYTIDFHEFEDPSADGARLTYSSRNVSALNLVSLGRGPSTVSLLEDVENDARRTHSREASSVSRNLENLSLGNVRPRLQRQYRNTWASTESSYNDRWGAEVLDQPNHGLSSNITPTFLTTYPDGLFPESYKSTTPSHSRKSSRAINHPPAAFVEYQHANPGSDDTQIDKFDDSHWTVEPSILANGGLINAVRKSTEGREFEAIWIGTIEGNGSGNDRISPKQKDAIAKELAENYNCSPLFPLDADVEGHYEHFCKVVLWPVLHYHMPNNLRGKAYEDNSWPYYYNVNRAFADKVIEQYKPGDTVWVQDYHLMLVPAMVREALPDAQIGFFLHTSFPSIELFRCVRTRTELLEGVLGADVVVLQTDEYADHFLQSCSRFLMKEVTKQGVQLGDRTVSVVAQPIGIVHEALEEQRSKDEPAFYDYLQDIEEAYKDKILIVARDKMDTVRGMRQKLLAYELFLKENPDLQKKVVLLQVATSTTALVEYHTSVRDIVQRIVDTYGAIDHIPLEFLPQDIPFASYVATISAADVLLITTLREGMGLTAQEFIYCQDGRFSRRKHGVVVLSEFTGTSALLDGNDLSCNPWDTVGTAAQIRRAVLMSAEDKAARWTKMMDIVATHTGGKWWADLQLRLQDATAHQRATIDAAELALSFSMADNRLLFIDYRIIAHLPPSKQLGILFALVAKAGVYILSSAPLDHFPTSIGLITNGGLSTRPPNGKWKHTTSSLGMYIPILQSYTERLDNARLDVQHSPAGPSKALLMFELGEDETATRLILEDLVSALWEFPVHVRPDFVQGMVEVSPPEMSPAHAVGKVLASTGDKKAFVLSLGAGRDVDKVVEETGGCAVTYAHGKAGLAKEEMLGLLEALGKGGR